MNIAKEITENMNTIQSPNMIEETSLTQTLSPTFVDQQTAVFHAKHPEMASIWKSTNEERYVPQTPVTPSMVMSLQSMENIQQLQQQSVKSELLTPDTFQDSLGPEELLAADDGPLFDGLEFGQANEWESLFLNDSLTCPEDTVLQPLAAVKQPELNNNESVLLPTQPERSPIQSNGQYQCVSPEMFMLPSEASISPSPIISDHSASASSIVSAATSLTSSTTSAEEVASIKKSSRDSRVDDLGITVYKRKPRTTPLKPVEIPLDADNVVAKRAKNTEAARRSRARKLERMSQLELRVRKLLDENESLRAEISRLKSLNKAQFQLE